jgi:hypothetical protein
MKPCEAMPTETGWNMHRYCDGVVRPPCGMPHDQECLGGVRVGAVSGLTAGGLYVQYTDTHNIEHPACPGFIPRIDDPCHPLGVFKTLQSRT